MITALMALILIADLAGQAVCLAAVALLRDGEWL
jgi:hypothetical protein